MQSELPYGGPRDDNFYSRVSQLLENLGLRLSESYYAHLTLNTYFLHVLLLSSSKVQHIVGIFYQDSALRFRLGDINGVCENCDFSSRHFLYIACRKSSDIGS